MKIRAIVSFRDLTAFAVTGFFLIVLVAGALPESSWAQEVEEAAPVRSPADLIERFAQAYGSMDLEDYGALLAHAPNQGVGFRFVLNRPTAAGETDWGYDEEMRIHRRMFRPWSIRPEERPLPRELWVRSIRVHLEPRTEFRERYDLYVSEQNPRGELDRKRWRATDAVYATDVTWFTQGGGTLHVFGEARFIVIEDRLAAPGEACKFQIYRWEDLGSGEVGVAQSAP